MSTRSQLMTFALILLIGLGIIGIRNLVEIRNLTAPSVDLVTFELMRAGREEIELMGVLQVENTNTRGIHLKELSYRLEINGHLLVDQTLLEEISLPPQSQQEIRLPLVVSTPEALQLARDSRSNNQALYQLDASVRVALPGAGSIRVPVTQSGILPIPQIPQINGARWQLQELSWLHIDLLLIAEVFNPNIFSIHLDSIHYRVDLQQLEVMNAGIEQALELRPEQSLELVLPVRLDLREVGRSLFAAIRQGEPLSYQLSAEAKVSSDWKLLQGYQVGLHREGEFILDLSPSTKREN